ncbi:MAG: hypothetical protein IJF12_02345 [Alphaproteobacteria bacterium]|nr:hypothetical protein [Alphaproteobacteria bacterium]MBQ2810989.1 hypothetical protein [Alphaproteobacteria bacterium]
MFGPKTLDKLPPTAPEVYRNKLRLEELSEFDPFAMTDLGGLQVLQNPDFEDFYKVLKSLRITDDNGVYLPRQTQDLYFDLVKISKQETFLELLYNFAVPDKDLYIDTLKEKLMINMVNLVIEPELPTDRALSAPEVFQVKDTFNNMLASAQM